jgi:hypothetical protein
MFSQLHGENLPLDTDNQRVYNLPMTSKNRGMR